MTRAPLNAVVTLMSNALDISSDQKPQNVSALQQLHVVSGSWAEGVL
jgi:hypothetical protein